MNTAERWGSSIPVGYCIPALGRYWDHMEFLFQTISTVIPLTSWPVESQQPDSGILAFTSRFHSLDVWTCEVLRALKDVKSLAIPVVPHKAVAEASEIGNL